MSSKPTTNTNTPPIEFTERAIDRAREAMQEESVDPSTNGIRVVAREKNCDCGSLAYQLLVEREPTEKDTVYSLNELDVILDPVSREYVEGATVDYAAGPGRGGFTVDNPNVHGGCGCGGHH